MSYLHKALAGKAEANRVGGNKLQCGAVEAQDPWAMAKYQEHVSEAAWITQEARKRGITANQFIAGDYVDE
jgi:hypothetical protein